MGRGKTPKYIARLEREKRLRENAARAADPQHDQKQKANKRVVSWFQNNKDRAISLVGKDQFNEDWKSFFDGDADFLKVWNRVEKYDSFLDALDAASYTDKQMQIIQDEIAAAQESGDIDRAFAYRDLYNRYVFRPELAGGD